MKKLLLLLFATAICTSIVFADAPKVLIEHFSWINCPYCPTAQAGLSNFVTTMNAAGHGDRFVVIKSMRANAQVPGSQSPGHLERLLIYNNTGVPSIKINGTTNVGNISNTSAQGIELAYNSITSNFETVWSSLQAESPINLATTFTLSETGYFTVTVNIAIVRTSNTNPNTLEVTPIDFENSRLFAGVKLDHPDPEYTTSHDREVYAFNVDGKLLSELFANTYNVGDNATYIFESDYAPRHPIQEYVAFSFVQRLATETNSSGVELYTNPIVYQASSAPWAGNYTYFTVTPSVGYAPMTATFNSLSYISGVNTTDYRYYWNFGNHPAGEFTSHEDLVRMELDPANPRWQYLLTGIYDVTLEIRAADGVTVLGGPYTKENAVTLNSTADGVVGTISTQTWTQNIPILGDIEIPFGETLTINEGVTIEMPANTSITVNGQLVVNGSENAPVTFTLKQGEPAGSTWAGLRLLRPGTNVTNPPVELNYVIFEKALSAVNSNYRNATINNCTFQNNDSGPRYELAPAIHLNRVGSVTVNNSVFRNNYKGVIVAETSTIIMRNCLITNNTGQNSGAIYSRLASTVTLDNCTVFNNTKEAINNGGTIYVTGTTAAKLALTIRNTIIDGNPPVKFGDLNGLATVTYSNYINYITSGQDASYPPAVFSMGSGVLFREDNLDTGGNLIPIFEGTIGAPGYQGSSTLADWILADGSICIDSGAVVPATIPSGVTYYMDTPDPANPTQALAPAKGTTDADMGFYGGQVPYSPPDPSVTGIVTFNNGSETNPILTPVITFTNNSNTGTSPAPVAISTTDGSYTIPSIKPGTYRVKVEFSISDIAYVWTRPTTVNVNIVSGEFSHPVTVPALFVIGGTVYYETSATILPGTTVTFTNATNNQYSPPATTADIDAKYQLVTTAGNYNVRLQGNRIVDVDGTPTPIPFDFRFPTPFAISEDDNALNLIMAPFYNISGIVTYGTGDDATPFQNATVSFVRAGDPDATAITATTNNTGAFTIPAQAGNYNVTATGAIGNQPYGYTRQEPYEVTANYTDFNITMVPTPFAVTGTVKYGTGQIAQAGVWVKFTNVMPGGANPADALTNESGVYTIRPLEGIYTVTVAAAEGSTFHNGATITDIITAVIVPTIDPENPDDPQVLNLHIFPALTEGDDSIMPNVTALRANYPNPFNPSTTIAFDVARNEHVTIDIYNISGQKVKTLVNRSFDAGRHTTVWNGDDQTGRQVGSGVYFYRMTAGKYTKTQKMLLMK